MTTTNFVKKFDGKRWLAAIKLPIYSVAIAPITLGTAVAYCDTGRWLPSHFWSFIGAAVCILTWLNTSNDVFDDDTGIDVNKDSSYVKVVGNKVLVFWASNAFLLLGLAGIGAIAWWQQDWTVLGLIVLAVALGYSYQGPPFRLGYLGLGEPICLLSFGPVAVAAAYYAQTQTVSPSALVASLAVGSSTSLILFCSHFHQVADDIAAGKRSPVVRLGTQRAARLLPWIVASPFAVVAIGVVLGMFSPWTLLIVASAPVAVELVRHVNAEHARPERVSNCKFIAAKLHIQSSILLCLGFVLVQWLH
ncbi:1,4-dihydroxy-2-naphthoate phytyltransferase [Rubidibacter lacunae KORDI 51-2]|uniref:2-carboxy-1,4-naphthoquinone phytyltransferase n=1 Tax=Rubidibacter lacunae KORDI 51-2 TaxID=582515 RepID=U5D6B2_9CHRO|nr:2-carboxy-1,4-naphthoquinone phytyltransferase [Rubidibacter lacunae]ERN40178.1 1,4-dihydroxy-2-naphthoate phytyltransferase [Rubidibacter lacunae KORDI 51-2]